MIGHYTTGLQPTVGSASTIVLLFTTASRLERAVDGSDGITALYYEPAASLAAVMTGYGLVTIRDRHAEGDGDVRRRPLERIYATCHQTPVGRRIEGAET